MKCAIVIPAGAVDEPVEELGGDTPLQAAQLPACDELALSGAVGITRTVPAGLPATSENALASVLGYDPTKFPVPRGPLEALALGVAVGGRDQVFRCNLATISDGRLLDFAAGYIAPNEAQPLIAHLNAVFGPEGVEFVAGRSYRNLLVWRDAGPLPKLRTVSPHDLVDQPVKKHAPRGRGSDPLRKLLKRAQEVLAEHDVNVVRQDLGENPANAIWPWGQGVLPDVPSFLTRQGLRGALVAGSFLARGLGQLIGWEVIVPPGATALPDTDYAAKGRAAVAALERFDLVCVHVEAPDEAGHLGDARAKVRALEAIDREIVTPVLAALKKEPRWRMLVMPDHATPVTARTHTAAPTVFALAGTGIESNRGKALDERNAAMGEMNVERGWELMEYCLRR
jgi:2,3-bisphosphoglycerate-independent phosphoglycerate mutase